MVFSYVNGNPLGGVDVDGLDIDFSSYTKKLKNDYESQILQFKTDLAFSQVSRDVKEINPIMIVWSGNSTNMPGYESCALASREANSITYYLSTWENQDGSRRYRARGRFLETTFHELQHLRSKAYTHGLDITTKMYRVFQDLADDELTSFLGSIPLKSSTYWGKE